MKMVKKKILSLALAALTLICALVAISFVKKASVYSVSLVFDTENALKERYFQNEVLTVPSAKISVNGTEYAADERVIHYPNGKAYTSAIHTLRDVGEYSVEYFALVNGKKISESEEFTVVKDFGRSDCRGGFVAYQKRGRKRRRTFRVDSRRRQVRV